VTGNPLNNCFALFLPGMAEDDALELWRAFGATGARDQLQPVFRSVENHPLLIQSLAGEVARFRRAPGDFDAWRRAHPDFDPFAGGELARVRAHVLEFALRGLADRARQALSVIAAFRMPASYDTLTALLIGEAKPCASELELDAVLAELEDRGLVGWDKRANRYDLHPIVRGVVWSGLDEDGRRNIYANLHAHFEAAPMIDDYLKVSRLEDLTPIIELYNSLIGLGRYDDAGILFFERLDDAMLYRLSANLQRIELLEMLFPDGVDQSPRVRDPNQQAVLLELLAHGYNFSGRPGLAVLLYRHSNTIRSEAKRDDALSVGLSNLSDALRMSGALCEAESAARRALVINRAQENRNDETISLFLLGLALAARGRPDESAAALQRALRIFVAQSGIVNAFLAQQALWLGAFAEARPFADRAWELAHVKNFESDFIRAARVQGAAALGLGDFAVADERLHQALTRARQVNLAEEELPALIALAELRRREGKPGEARELLDDVWDGAERGPYPLLHADAFNILAQIERDAGNRDAAVEAATKVYRLAWCDGPPFAYHWGLEAARKHLRELGAPEPEMPPFDPSMREPMPEVEIDPEDEFHGGKADE
jgi:tetratricopeptide (TPR) repeat protein